MNEMDQRRLRDILKLAQEIQTFLPETEDVLNSDLMRKRAIERSLELIGELATKISEETKEEFPAIDWRDLMDFRIILAHNYQRVSVNAVWAAATSYLPVLEKEISSILKQQ